jgi:hypothetical protein
MTQLRGRVCGGLALLAGLTLLAAGADARAQGAKKSDAVVKASAEATRPDADGKQTVTLKLTVERPWHLYANPVGLDDLADAQTTVTVTNKNKPEVLKTAYPAGKVVKDEVVGNYKVYEDTVTIKLELRRAKGDTGPVELAVKLQACNDRTCLLPATLKVTAE